MDMEVFTRKYACVFLSTRGVQNESIMLRTMVRGSAVIHVLKVLILLWISACIVPTSADAYPVERNGDAPLSGSHTALAVLVGVGSLIGLVYALFNCACCDESSLLKYEETPEEDAVNVEADDDFRPPTESTPNEQKSSVPSEEATPKIGASTGAGIDTTALKAFDDPKLQFSRDQLNYIDEIGSGWFGKALRGEAHQIYPGMRKTRVVVKQLRDSATPDEQVMFVKEVQPYREVNHPNVLMLMGQCLETSPLLLIMEYAPNGDLKAFLQRNKDKTQSFAQDDVQLKMATDVVSGLLWLHQKDFVHIDLAARNCQVCADDVIKIGDYGTSLEKYPNDYYMTKDERHAVPIRWLAPEVIDAMSDNIEPKKITKQSNIWSFGVIMLELSTGADMPYANMSDEEVLQKIVRERQIQLDKPNLAMKYADRWFETMMFCWLNEDDRPSTKEVHDLMHHLKSYKDQLNKDDFESRWNALKPAATRGDVSSESSIEVPSPQRKVDEDKTFESNFVEEEISVTPEEHQMRENPFSQFEEFAPRAEEEKKEQTPEKAPDAKPLLKDLMDTEGKFGEGGDKPFETSTPMPSPAVLSQDRTRPISDTSNSYVTATSSFLESQPEDGDNSTDVESFNTLVESMMDETIASLGAKEDEAEDENEEEDAVAGITDDKKDVNQNGEATMPDLFHSEAGLAISGKQTEDDKEDEKAPAEEEGVGGFPGVQINVEVPKTEEEAEVLIKEEPKANGHTPGGGVTPVIEQDDDNKDCKRGKLDFSVKYNEQKMDLECSIHRAHDLKAMDPNGFSDPYVKLHILPRASSRSTKLRTKTKFKTLNPQYMEELQYHGITTDDLQTKTLRLSVWDEDSLGHNDFIGEYLLPLKKLPLNETKSYSVFLQDQSEEDEDLSGGERGKILLGLQYFKAQNQMSVNIVRCSGLFAMDSNGYSDPYVKLYLQPDPQKKTKKKTGTKKKTLNPEYKETFVYKLPAEDLHTKTLEVTVWDKDVGSNDYIGGVQLGSNTKGDRRQHWTDAIENPDQLIERWHMLSETQFREDD
ncbi:uncharacterized protein [Apostichopus japonicus]|uniref:uncharacterized protein isoform X4 n=1 Tax=Stichopus japonicus TaxID=307972 RepID=UPI003AB7E73C